MGLRSQSLLVLLAVVTAGLLAATLWWWPALARRGARPVLLRIAAVGALQLSVLGLIFVWVNRSQEFYASWSDLLGTSTVSGHIRATGAGAATGSAAARPGRAAVPLTTSRARGTARPARGKQAAVQLQAVRFAGPVSGISASGYVFLPPGYSPTGPRLPVLLLLSSELRNPSASYGAQRVAATAAAMMNSRRLPKLIIVMLPPGVAGRSDPGCLDVPGGPQATTFFTQDVPQAVEGTLRASTLAAHWGVLAGPGSGYCALQLATSAASPFSVAVAPDGGYVTPPGSPAATSWLTRQDSIAWRLQHWPAPPLQVLVTGIAGPGGIAALARLPLQVTLAGTAGPQPLAPVLTWAGRAVSTR